MVCVDLLKNMVHELGTVCGGYDRLTFLPTKALNDVSCFMGDRVEWLTFLPTKLGTVYGVYDRLTFLTAKALDDVGCLMGDGVQWLAFLTAEIRMLEVFTFLTTKI